MYRCIGCDMQTSWDGTGMFSYTCSCGATIFWSEETSQLSMPGLVAIGISEGRSLPHLDDLVGRSDFTSPSKKQVIEELQEKGFIWMEECEQCKKDGTLKRAQERGKHRLMQEAERIIAMGDQ